jgi:two-component system LytT family response regulator
LKWIAWKREYQRPSRTSPNGGAKLHVGRATHLVRTTLTALEQELDPARFARVHRSAIVALDRVRELLSLGGGEYRVVLADGTQVPMSQRYRDRLP